MSKRIELLIIDPQVDFCDPNRGALYVPGAEQDMKRLAKMIGRLRDKLADVHVTLDSHHFIHIAHPIFWRDTTVDFRRNASPCRKIVEPEFRSIVVSRNQMA